MFDSKGQPVAHDGLQEAVSVLDHSWSTIRADVGLSSGLKAISQLNVYYPDVIVVRGSADSPHAQLIKKNFVNFKKALFVEDGYVSPEEGLRWDLIFSESLASLASVSMARQAYGINANLFRPLSLQPKLIDALYPAPFTDRSNHILFADYCQKNKLRGVAVGELNPDEPIPYEACLNKGVSVLPSISAESMVWLYNASKEVVVCSELVKPVLEARACGVPVKTLNCSPQLELMANLTREEIVSEWNERNLAFTMDKYLREIL